MTVASNLVLEAGMREGETVLVHGGTGGIGTVAIQLVKGMDARVLTTVGSDDALPIVAQPAPTRRGTAGSSTRPPRCARRAGADVILDVVGGSALADNVAMLNEGGRLVIIGTFGGASGELPIGQLMAKRARADRPDAAPARWRTRPRSSRRPATWSGRCWPPGSCRSRFTSGSRWPRPPRPRDPP